MSHQTIPTAAVVLVRGGSSAREVFWTRRPEGRGFLSGFRSYFVGRLRDVDGTIPMEPPRDGCVPEPEFIGCGARELFEEAGLLALTEGWVASWRADNPVACPAAGGWEALREAVAAGDFELGEVLADAGLAVDARRFVSVGAWPTPSWTSPRFETEFFVLHLDELDETAEIADALPEHVDSDEHAVAEWVAPREALERWRSGREFLSAPIRRVLAGLAEVDSDARGWEDPLDEPFYLARGDERDAIDVEMMEITGGIRLLPLRTPTLPPATHTNCYLVGDGAFAIVDPGAPTDDEQQLLADAVGGLAAGGLEPKAVVLTHHHRDHVGGAGDIATRFDLPVWAHAETAARLESLVVDRHLEHGDALELGNRTLRCLHTPGHAPGHLCLAELTTDTVLAGDLVAAEGTIVIDPPDGHMGSYLGSLREIRRLEPRALLPAHGMPITPAAAVDDCLAYYISHRLERESKVLAALRQHDSAAPEDLVPSVYDDAPRSVWPLAARSLLAHLIHLVDQGEAVREGEVFRAIR